MLNLLTNNCLENDITVTFWTFLPSRRFFFHQIKLPKHKYLIFINKLLFFFISIKNKIKIFTLSFRTFVGYG